MQLEESTRARVLQMHRGEGHALRHGEHVAAALASFATLEGPQLMGDGMSQVRAWLWVRMMRDTECVSLAPCSCARALPPSGGARVCDVASLWPLPHRQCW